MALRRAKISDSKFYFILRNQMNTRKFSLNKKKIPYAKHQKWFLLNYKKKNNFFFIITHKNLARYIKKNKILRAKVDLNNISSINLFNKSGFKIKLVNKKNLIMIKKI